MARGLLKTLRALAPTLVLCVFGACVVAVAVCVMPCPAHAQGTFNLKFEPFTDNVSPLANIGRRNAGRLGRKPSQVSAVPESLSTRAAYLLARLIDQNVYMVIEPSDPPVLYVDTDLDGDLSDEKPLTGSKIQQNKSRFPACAVRDAGRDDAVPVRIALEAFFQNGNVRYVAIGPGGAYTGQINLGDRTCTFAIADNDFDGRYDRALMVPEGKGGMGKFDFIWLDANGDGQFSGDWAEVRPLAHIVFLGDVYYSITVKADGSLVSIEETVPEFGALSVSSRQVQTSAYSGAGSFEIHGGDEAQQLPVDRYQVGKVNLSDTDEAGDTWTLSGLLSSRDPRRFEIAEGETTTFEAGPPLTLSADVHRRGENVTIGVILTGQGGETYIAGVAKNGKRLDPPKFKILDEKGKVLASGAFKYG